MLFKEVIKFFFFKQKTAYDMRISDWSSDVCSSDLAAKARATKQIVAVSNVKVSEAPALPVETAVHTAPETVIIPRLNSIPDLNPSPEIKIGSASCRERVCQYV